MANIPMKTLKLHGLDQVYEFVDPEAVAPSGYGLGEAVTLVDHWDNATECGFYASANGLPDGADGNTHHGIVYRYGGWIWQEIRRTATDANYKLIRKKTENGEWGPWEWDNPPMVLGVEYRTTERVNGRVVYAKFVGIGRAPNNQMVDVDLNTPAVEPVRSITISNYIPTGVKEVLPVVNLDKSLHATAKVTNGKLYATITSVNFDGGSNDLYMRVWYHKD